MNASLPLHHLHVWHYDVAGCDATIDALRHWLTSEEYQRAYEHPHGAVYARQKAARRFILSRITQIPPKELALAQDTHGKPFLTQAPSSPPLGFSVSHSGGRWVMAAGPSLQLGIDLEHAPRARNILRIAERYFHPNEARTLTQTAPEKQHALFYRYWTLKEAFLKAVGCGISGGLDQLHVTSTTPVTAVIAPEFLTQHPQAHTHWQWEFSQIADNTALALAYTATEHLPVVHHTITYCAGQFVITTPDVTGVLLD